MRLVYLDPFSGIAGDMLVGALLDLGASFDAVRAGLSRLDVEPYELRVGEVSRGALRATKFDVLVGGHYADSHEHREHAHGAPHVPVRGLREIRAIIENADLPERVRERSLAAFRLLAEAEGGVHGAAPDEVHFHEVGAVDALCDIVGTALALEDLGVDGVRCGVLRVGSGFVQCAHGKLPVPGPATIACLAGFDVRFDDGRGELVTPTGACLVGALAMPGRPVQMRVDRVGYGAGTRDDTDVPNVLRAVLGEVVEEDGEQILEIRTNVDHLAPNVLAAAMERVLAAGAIDAYTAPVTMKKGRAAHVVTALVPRSRRDDVEAVLFRETGTLGVRVTPVERTVLERSFLTAETPWGSVPVKVGRHGGHVTSREPEMDVCRRLADEHSVPVADVVAAARRAQLGPSGEPG